MHHVNQTMYTDGVDLDARFLQKYIRIISHACGSPIGKMRKICSKKYEGIMTVSLLLAYGIPDTRLVSDLARQLHCRSFQFVLTQKTE